MNCRQYTRFLNGQTTRRWRAVNVHNTAEKRRASMVPWLPVQRPTGGLETWKYLGVEFIKGGKCWEHHMKSCLDMKGLDSFSENSFVNW